MSYNKASLIDQVNWLLLRLSIKQILRVLSVANRIFVTEPCSEEVSGID